MTAINYEIFDDLLIGNFMKTVLHGGVRSLYPDFTPYVAKYGDNGRAFTVGELHDYFPRIPQGLRLPRMVRASARGLLPKDTPHGSRHLQLSGPGAVLDGASRLQALHCLTRLGAAQIALPGRVFQHQGAMRRSIFTGVQCSYTASGFAMSAPVAPSTAFSFRLPPFMVST